MRLLVTGGAGYIGSVATALLLESGHDVTALDDLSTGHRDAVPDGARFVRLDLRDGPALDAFLATAERYDAVVHLAALSLVGDSAVDPARYFRHNVTTTANVVDAMRRHGIGTVVFSSTAAVYGEPAALPVTEDHPTRPTNAYGGSKLACDQLLGFAATAYGLAAVSLRYFNVAGAYGRHGERHTVETHLIPSLLAVAAGEQAQVHVNGTDFPTADGTAVRDYVHVRDIAAAHLLALDAARPGEHIVCNLGNGVGCSVAEVLDAVAEVTGAVLPMVAMPRRPGDPARLVASADRAREILGWAPKHPDITTMIADAWAQRRG